MRSYDVTVFDSPLQASERPTPEPTGEEALVRITAAGVCHSDLHICEGFYDLGGGKKLNMAERGMKLPLTMGHEIAGEIVSAGPQSAPVTAGEKVVVYPWIGCGECAVCARGDENLCLKSRFLGIFRGGGYATHVLVPHKRYCLPIGDLDPAIAAPYACSGVTTFSALNKVGRDTLAREPIVVIGAGGLGLMCLSLMKAMGAKGAIVVDIDAAKRDAAFRAGALAAIDPTAPDAVAQIRALTPDGAGAAAAIDLVGAGPTVQLALDSIARGGKVIVVGLIGGEITLSTPLIPQRALTLQGSYVGNLKDLSDLMALVAAGKVPPIPTQVRPLEEANAALDALRAGKVVGRVVLKP
jgi:D-arabinose 1-dehydrogenase-like Zn-dependent alcohol dehydrogenase